MPSLNLKRFIVVLSFIFVKGCISVAFAEEPVKSFLNLKRSEFHSLGGVSTSLNSINVFKNGGTLVTNGDSITKVSRLQFGGYGEAVVQKMFYSDNVQRYSKPDVYKDATHSVTDLPHVVFWVGYQFGRGWSLGSEIEFEHGGSGAAYEIENEETGEYETEIEKGGEVNLEQFWIEKRWSKVIALRMGHMVIPVGLTNYMHMPNEFFTVLRPEEETSMIPSTWHETGISLRGKLGKWGYEAMLVNGLAAERFSNSGWVSNGSISPYETTLANAFATAVRIDNFSIKNLRIGVSGYYGHSGANSLKSERYKDVKGAVTIGSMDAVFDNGCLFLRGNLMAGFLSDAGEISEINKKMPSASPSPRTDVASRVVNGYLEAGYDILPWLKSKPEEAEALMIFTHLGYYDSMNEVASGTTRKAWCKRYVYSGGINYSPMKELRIKLEYSCRIMDSPWGKEPTISAAVTYTGLFLK
ncbi:MAG: hypothetical protein LWX70_04675 [Sphingobacteriia bacterium]|nr:hypothetical protein [Sphingobacteriia bacterium]